jgi:hypothetical protein
MKFIETYHGVLVNFDDISCFDNDYDEDKGYCVSSIILKNGLKIPFIDEIAKFTIPDNDELFFMHDGEMSLLHQCFLRHISLFPGEVMSFHKSFDVVWKDFENEFRKTIHVN